jgi:hypothetical protein
VRLFSKAGLPVHAPGPTCLGNIIASAFRRQQRFF